LDLWAHSNGVKLDCSRPGKPTDNAVIESFNGRLRDECLNQHWFLSLDEARAVTEAWKEDYNRVRPHGALGNRTPSDFARPVAGHAQLPDLHGKKLGLYQVGGRSRHGRFYELVPSQDATRNAAFVTAFLRSLTPPERFA
jgi:hypothetical protein